MAKGFITKHALAKGVQRVDLLVINARFCEVHSSCGVIIYRGDEWHLDAKAAIAKARKMRVAKMASLQRQLVKLRRMKFDSSAIKG